MRTARPNLLVVDTPFQLLNGIEALYQLAAAKCHLVVVEDAGRGRAAFSTLIAHRSWETVTFLSFAIDTASPLSRVLARSMRPLYHRWCSRLQHVRHLGNVSAIARSLGSVNKLLLGHYSPHYKPYMRHFANTVRYADLYILDDGTDTVAINQQRLNHWEHPSIPTSEYWTSGVSGTINWLRRHIYNWKLSDAPKLTFFTIYQLQTNSSDRVVRNNYSYLRQLASECSPSDEVLFIGQDLVYDGSMTEQSYIAHMRTIRERFAGRPFVYVPHPKEEQATADRLRGALGFEIRRFSVPIEFALMSGGLRPAVVASFCSSALESCAAIYGDQIEAVAFQIDGRHLCNWQEKISAIYRYYGEKTQPHFSLVPLEIPLGHDDPRPTACS